MSGITKTLFGGSDSKSTQKSSSQLDPRLFKMFDQNFNRATGVADNLGVRQFAGFTPDYNAGADVIRNTVNGAGMNAINTGIGIASQSGKYTPQNISGGSFLNSNIDAYMNPYLRNVADTTMNDMFRARQIQGQSDNYSATQAGAFGGSRHGVAEAETNRNFYDVMGRQLADLYGTGFNAATGLAGQDLDRGLQADQSNQTAGLTANAQQLAAADSLAKLGLMNQTMGLEGGQALQNLGMGYQQFDQQQLDAIRNLPIEQQSIINEALGINPAGGSGMQSTSSGSSSSSSQNGMFKDMGALIGTAMFLSDKNAKENMSEIDDPLEKLRLLSGQEYNYIGDGQRTAGVMAQDVERVMPGAVATSPFGSKMVNYPEVTGLLVEAVNELARKQKRG
jgi:hypothetical protein